MDFFVVMLVLFYVLFFVLICQAISITATYIVDSYLGEESTNNLNKPITLRERMEFFEESVGPNQFYVSSEEFSYNNLSTSKPIMARVTHKNHKWHKHQSQNREEGQSLQPFFKYLHADVVVDFGKEFVLIFYPSENMLFNGNIQKLVGAVTRVVSHVTDASDDNEAMFMDVKVFNVVDMHSVAEYLLWCGNRLHMKDQNGVTRVAVGRDLPETSIKQDSTYNKNMWRDLLKI